MIDWIDRYTHEVARRLPENERDDVKRELTANIYDMLSDNPDESEIKETLSELGSPAAMAENYRAKPRYLIGPALYDSYLRTLKWLVPLVGCILLAIGAIIGVVESLGEGSSDASRIVTSIFSQGLSFGLSGAFQALVWTTIGFVIAERTGTTVSLGSQWTVEDLRDIVVDDKSKISLADSIVELVLIVFFSILLLLICLELIPIDFILKIGTFEIRHLFSQSFIVALIPVVIIGAIFGILESVAKIVKRRWTPLVCAAVTADALVGIAILFYLFMRPQIFDPAFISFIESQDWFNPDFAKFLAGFPENPAITVILPVIVVASLASIGIALYRTFKASGRTQIDR